LRHHLSGTLANPDKLRAQYPGYVRG
jgi:hypothetical protein